MINEVDEALRALIRADALAGTDVEVALEAPTRDWASRRSGPTVSMYLYDIREDNNRRVTGTIRVLDEDGKVVGYRQPPRTFRLAYLLTAWTQRPEDEHRLLAAMMACFLRHDVVPEEHVPETLRDGGYPLGLAVAQPPPDNRKIPDVWSSLGGDLKPSLDVVVTLAVDVDTFIEAATRVMLPLRLRSSAVGDLKAVDDERSLRLPEPDEDRPPADPAPVGPARR
ncbi:MAG TPA: DUF4255 domain-containing protein [Acidimicrobiales bacterium]|nr:DUF4255 domain-containing protein [Acidimicrobiales bacterium]